MLLLRQYWLPISTALVAALATLAVAAVPQIELAYRRPALHVGIETAAALIALLVSFLAFGRFLRSRSLADLVLASALGALAAGNLVAALAAALETPSRFAIWAPLGTRLVGSALFAVAAFTPDITLRRPRAAARWAFAALVAILAGIAVAVAVAGTALPVGVETELAGGPGRPNLHGHPVVVAVLVLSMVFFAAAAVGFARRAANTGDELLGWVAVGAVFACFARGNYALYPSLYSDWVYSGDVFRLLFYVALLVGAAREIRMYWDTVAQSAVLEERRRIARDLHDGAAQELAFILRRLRTVAGSDERALGPLAAAAERGLEDSRRAIAALSRPPDEALDTALAHAVAQVAGRTGIRLALDLAEDVVVPAEVREDLIRIACEAVNNAANHSGADEVRVELADGERLHLRVLDEGSGFDPNNVVHGLYSGYGLAGMRERTERLGGRLRIVSSPGAGTRIEVELA